MSEPVFARPAQPRRAPVAAVPEQQGEVTPYAAPSEYDLNIYRGDTYSWQFNLWQDAAKTIPYDLTNTNVKAEIRDRPGGATVIALAPTVGSPLANSIVLTLSAALSGTVPVGGGVWDLQLTKTTTSWVTTVVWGKVLVTDDVTDSTG
jgi:hypothetical protein